MALRITEHRKRKGITQQQLADELGVHLTNVNRMEKGKSDVSFSRLEQVAKALNVAVTDLFSTPAKVPLVGRVGAGGVVDPADPSDVDYVDMPPGGTPDLEALEVVNGSMQPVYRAGDLLFISPSDAGMALETLVGVECVVDTADGRRLVKVLRRGTGPDLWRLESYNPAVGDIEDTRIAQAVPVRHVTKRLAV